VSARAARTGPLFSGTNNPGCSANYPMQVRISAWRPRMSVM
jgi:hypothetical protein